MIAPSQKQPDTATAVSEGAAQSVPPVALAAMPEAGRTDEDTARGSLGLVVAVERISGGLPARGEPPLQWMAPQYPTSTLFSLDDASESMEQESLDIGSSAMMDALN
jgi:hypothetical protein